VPIRIYALAKDLQIDSKELVDICTKAGIPGKGSALASLTDDEVIKVKAFLASSGAAPGAGGPSDAGRAGAGIKIGRSSGLLRGRRPGQPAAPPVPQAPLTRDDYISPSGLGGKIKIIGTRRPSKQQPPVTPPPAQPAPAAAPAEPETPPADAPAVATPAAATVPTAEPPVAPPPADVPVDDAPFRQPYERGDQSSIKIIGGPKKRTESGERRPKRRAPIINVAPAPMPEIKQPPTTPKVEEPKTQKPEIRLPKEALTLRKGQRRPPLEHLTEKKPKKETKRGAAHAGTFEEESEEVVARRGAPGGRRGATKETKETETPDVGMVGMASARADRKARRATRKAKGTTLVNPREGEQQAPRKRKTLIHKGTNTAAPRKGKVALELPCTVRSFSEAAGVSAMQVQKVLMGMGLMLTINSVIDDSYVEMLAAELGVDLDFKAHETLEDALVTKIRETADAPDDLRPRPPVVTFLGHVDQPR